MRVERPFYNIHELKWDEELLSLLDIPFALLPKVVSSSEEVGKHLRTFLEAAIPISGIAGDQQAALFGQLCLSLAMSKTPMEQVVFA